MYNRLSDPVAGFNPGIAANSANYGLNSTFAQLNFNTATTQNFWFAQIDPDMLEASGILTYPFGCLYIKESANTNIEKFHQFSGLVRCVFELNFSWTPIKGMQNFEAYPNCVEDVVFDVINRVENQNWMEPLVYNGGIQCRRGPVLFGANNYKQQLGFGMLFELNQ